MKKRIAIILLAAAVLMLAACGKKAEKESAETEQAQITEEQGANLTSGPDYSGYYWRTWSEEIGGSVVEMNAYLILNEDHTGYWIVQDAGKLTWDDSQLTLTVGVTMDYEVTEENGKVNLLLYEVQDAAGKWIPTRFEKIETLPPEAEIMLAYV